MSEYRDYGTIGDLGVTDSPVNSNRYTQVYHATHEGEQWLSFARRSFISFTFGGKHIEDFNLIATTSGDRMERAAYAPFEDNTTTNENLSGQQYWGTHYQAHSISFTLATDGMDQRQLEDFRYWFRAGETRELILAEHPNRGILARVSDPPQFSLLPFESNTTIMISNVSYPVKTTLYKGEITLNLVMDEPHWYSIENILGKKVDNRYIDMWTDVNGNEVSIFASQDALKILYEDGIPLGSMIQNNMLLGNGAYASVEGQVISKVWSIANDEDIEWENGVPSGEGARVEADDATSPYLMGVVSGAIIDATGDGIFSLSKHASENDQNVGHFYYSGTAPAPAIISFTLTPTIGSDGYISSPYNFHTATKYNTITIESTTKQELRFTTPNLLTSYNRAIDIFTACANSGYTWEDIRERIRDEVRHPATRKWAISVIDSISNTTLSSSSLSSLKDGMRGLIENSGTIQPMEFTFNSETGDAIGKLTYNTGSIFETCEEDVGDMLQSNYIIIRDRNYPTTTGAVVSWEINGKTQSHRIYHDVDTPLTKLSILYKNMYL